MNGTLLVKEELERGQSIMQLICDELDRLLLGREHLHQLATIALVSRGHVLLEGLPGLGKTALVKALGDILQMDFKRIQFTPDLMPSDILGSHILQQDDRGNRNMVFRKGPVFTHILLADEINRASPKTQSALLEAMQEQTVTLLGETHTLPDPFFVLASQNPIEQQGTYPLPEAQMDRFMFKLLVNQPDLETLADMVNTRVRGITPPCKQTVDGTQLVQAFDCVDRVFLSPYVGKYIARLVKESHPQADGARLVDKYVSYGASPRALFALSSGARAHALLNGRPTVGFEDVDSVASAALNHRLVLNYKAGIDQVTATDIVADLVHSIQPAELDVPKNVQMKA
ncbi:MAG: AAA family ATPase [Acidobacteria bacterium]|nr:AAA family ATPase [Acidobacteriota bacterium]